MGPLTPDLIFHVAEFLALMGFYYGVVRTKLNAIEKIANELVLFRNDSLTRNGAAGEWNGNINDKIEHINDRLDTQGEAINEIEKTLAREGMGD